MKNSNQDLALIDLNALSALENDWFEERAAILEFEAGFTRQQAEKLAWQEIQQAQQEKIIKKAG